MVAPADGLLFVTERGCWVMITCGGISEPLIAKMAESWLPPTGGFVNVIEATGWFKPAAARLIVVWYKFGLLDPGSSKAKVVSFSRPKPWRATFAVVPNQS